MKVERASVWAEAVFHVLAHLDVDVASSCFSRSYMTWIEGRLGRTTDATWGDGVFEMSHDVLARAQALAWVFDSAAENRACSDSDLDEVVVRNDEALHIARAAGFIAEVLRATAEVEMLDLEVLPPYPFDEDELVRALSAVLPAAPFLADFTIAVTPPLGLRGRVLGSRIFTGVPGIADATAEHVAWQAAHEATVMAAARDHHDFVAVERDALRRLRLGARRAGLVDAHAVWLSHLDLRSLGPIPDVDDTTE